jgi:outer membrane protein assembly factor BamB
MKIRILIMFLFLWLFGLYAVLGNADELAWPRWRGPNGDGISMEADWAPEALAGGPKILWKVEIGAGHSNVAIKNNRLYTIGTKGVFCLNADTGEEVWRYSDVRFVGPQSTPTVDGNFVYALSYNGSLFCLKTKNGKLRWEKDLVNDLKSPFPKYGFASSPVVEGDLVILNAKTTAIALNKKTGDMIWEGVVIDDKIGRYFSTPVIYNHDGKRYVLTFRHSGLFSMNAKTGELLWFYEWTKSGSPNVVDPMVFDNKVFISSSETDARCALLDIKGNEPNVLWENENMSNHISTSVYIDGYLYGIDGDYHRNIKDCSLRSIDFKTGDLMWEKEMRGASLMAANGKLIILEDNGTLHIAEATPSAYKEISSGDVLLGEQKFRKFWTPPVLYKGKIYCRNNAGDLICIDVSE